MKLLCNGCSNALGVDPNDVRLSFSADGERYKKYLLSVTCDGEEILARTFTDSEPHIHHLTLLEYGKKYSWSVSADGKVLAREEFETMPRFSDPTWISAENFDGRTLVFSEKFYCKCTDNARLFITGLGFFDAKINGRKIDDFYYKPHLTNYKTRKKSQCDTLEPDHGERITLYTYDVGRFLNIGKNILEISVAPGFYCNDDKISVDSDYSYGTPSLFYTLTAGGEAVASSRDNNITVAKSRECSTLYIGQKIDFTAPETVPAAPKKLGENDGDNNCDAPDGKFTSPKIPDDTVIETIAPKTVKKYDGSVIYDFGKNHTGGLKMRVKGRRADKLTVNFAEILNPDGTPNFETGAWHGYNCYIDKSLDVYQKAEYILSGEVDEITPTFSWNCYRYAEITADSEFEVLDIHSLYVSSDIEYDGKFVCSDETLNRINEMFINTLKCNFHHGIISDCPHRERLPYTGDGRLIMNSVLYTADSIAFYYKWLYDLLDTQQLSGFMPNTAPYINGGGGYAWANALCTVPMNLYKFTGDLCPIALAYPQILKLIDFYNKHHNGNYCITGNGQVWLLGDWLAPDMVTSDPYYISTVCFYEAVTTAVHMATLLDNGDAERLNLLADNIKSAVISRYFNADTLDYGNGVQGENVLALYYGLYDETYYEELKAKVEYHYRHETDYHLDTGIVITPILIRYLTENGMEDIAFKIMTAKTYPSYHYLMDGETTFPEHWSKVWPDYTFGGDDSKLVKGGGDLSHCHPMYGSVVEWLYTSVAGLDLSTVCDGYITVAPKFVGMLKEAYAENSMLNGISSVKWTADESDFKISITVPAGLKARFYIPDNVDVISHKSFDAAETFNLDNLHRNDKLTMLELSNGKHEIFGKIM